ncbi:hypothetical protein [Flavobacterium crassostreae]|uniref:Uncharacterized protein n=1 Tax=Flavobacterium crassostreae TaxID=1763534 RepID=A0A1B9E7T1_9FLAO|nr:hypothetical protein [Flavobacterium crassostreae]OCB77993.1 hypothetical protein LPBF_03325 [Flavobacterium crassostreae]
MNQLITAPADIISELTTIQSFLEITMSEDANEAVVRGNDLAVYMSRTGKLIADAKIHREQKLRSQMIQEYKKLLEFPASVAVKYTDTLVENETYSLTWATRLNAACTHQLDWCRTIISKAKAEMSAFNQ